MVRRRLRRLFWTGLILSLPLLVTLYMMLAKPGDAGLMVQLLFAGIPGTPGLIILIWWSVLRSRPRLPEDDIELRDDGRPNLAQYDKPLDAYREMFILWTAPTTDKALAHRRREHALWGVVAHGLDGVAFIASLLADPRKEIQSDGLFLFHELVAEQGIDAIANMDSRPWTRDALVELIDALGNVRARQALPLLAKTVASDEEAVRTATVRASAAIVETPFDSAETAAKWLADNIEANAS